VEELEKNLVLWKIHHLVEIVSLEVGMEDLCVGTYHVTFTRDFRRV